MLAVVKVEHTISWSAKNSNTGMSGQGCKYVVSMSSDDTGQEVKSASAGEKVPVKVKTVHFNAAY